MYVTGVQGLKIVSRCKYDERDSRGNKYKEEIALFRLKQSCGWKYNQKAIRIFLICNSIFYIKPIKTNL